MVPIWKVSLLGVEGHRYNACRFYKGRDKQKVDTF